MIKRLSIVLIILMSMPIFLSATTPQWEELPRQADVELVEQDDIEIKAQDGYVYITTTRPVTVKIYTILGQLVSSEDIPEGTYRKKISSRGIYILKVGSMTRRISI